MSETDTDTDPFFGEGGLLDGSVPTSIRSLKLALVLLSLGGWALVIYYAVTLAMPRGKYGVVFLGIMILAYITSEMITAVREKQKFSLLGLPILALFTIATTVYIFLEYSPLISVRVGYALTYEYAFALAMTITIGYLTYRKYGLAFFMVFFGALVYGLIGQQIPGVFAHGGFSVERLMQILVLDVAGFYGSLNQIVAAWIALFLLYAGLLRGYGAFDLIIRIAFKAAEYSRSGVAQSAVIASLIVGSINGSAAANAAMTGSFTIPLMERSGMKPESAGGIEAVASSGGQIMPPVMGAAAFVMASVLGVTYWTVLSAGIIPALIFFISVAIAVHYTAIGQIDNFDLDVSNHVDEMKGSKQMLWEALRFLIPLSLLIYLLGIAQWTIMSAALYTVAAMIVTGLTFPILEAIKTNESTPLEALKGELMNTVEGFLYGVEILAPIAIIVAAINAVVDIFQTTGVPGALSLAILDISGGNMLFAVILAMIICIILGLGMPTVAAYTIVALLIAPTLAQNFFLPELAVHFFVFYAAVLSGLTPPIAIAVVVAAGVAGADFWKTAIEALKIAAPLYILPIAFVYNSELIVGGLSVATLFSVALTILGAVAISHGLNYQGRIFGLEKKFDAIFRFAYFALGVVGMAYPDPSGRVIVIGLAVGLYVIQTLRPSALMTPERA